MFNLLITLFVTVIQTDGIDRLTRDYDDQLTKVLQWEILWNQTPTGFHNSSNGRVRIAAYREQRSFAYCSRDVGVCVEYRIDVNRNWQVTRSAVCDQNQTNEECLMTFTTGLKPSAQSRPPVNVGPGGLG